MTPAVVNQRRSLVVPKTPENDRALAELLADPIVQMVMKADRVTEQELVSLISATLSRLGAGSKDRSALKGTRSARDYRPSVGIMLLNRANQVFVGRRRKADGGAWQMPQGGIEEGEDPRAAAFRELKEEIGTDKAEILAESKNWLYYDFPGGVADKGRHKGRRGQRQKWFVMRFNGADSDININTAEAEFSDWKWVSLSELVDLVVPFKRLVYLSVLEEFHDAVEPFAEGV
jgi:putative (di)nucleoside polyphosphate hydrolase